MTYCFPVCTMLLLKPTGKSKKTFKIVFANWEESFLLNVDEKTPLMRIKDLVYDDHNHPLHIMQEIICSDKFTYAVNH